MLEIKNLKKTYKGGKTAVANLSLSVKPGDIYGFIGHNGAGKTTTIKCVVGIHDFDEGEILVEGVGALLLMVRFILTSACLNLLFILACTLSSFTSIS